MQNLRIAFMGTPEFATPSLKKLIDNNYNISCVVTQMDTAKGRSKKLLPSPVKELAIINNIEVLQSEKIRKDIGLINYLKDLKLDLIVVVAYGQILSKEILEIPKYGCINVHSSLLPAYRGAAPINWAIINGDKTTGVTTMLMDTGLDTGDILLKKEVLINDNDTAQSLTDKLSIVGADLLCDTINEYCLKNKLSPQKQGETTTEYAKMLTKDMGNIDFNMPAKELSNLIRGINIWPVASCLYNNKKLKIYDSTYLDLDIDANPGEIVNISKNEIHIKCKKGILILKELQIEGKKRMPVNTFLLGNKLKIGDKFESI